MIPRTPGRQLVDSATLVHTARTVATSARCVPKGNTRNTRSNLLAPHAGHVLKANTSSIAKEIILVRAKIVHPDTIRTVLVCGMTPAHPVLLALHSQIMDKTTVLTVRGGGIKQNRWPLHAWHVKRVTRGCSSSIATTMKKAHVLTVQLANTRMGLKRGMHSARIARKATFLPRGRRLVKHVLQERTRLSQECRLVSNVTIVRQVRRERCVAATVRASVNCARSATSRVMMEKRGTHLASHVG
jgi:hypothetical protein